MSRRSLGIVAVNLVVLVGLLAGIEGYFRHIHPRPQSFQFTNGLWQTFKPYVMLGTAVGNYGQWTNNFTGTLIASTVQTNSDGFNDAREFSLTKPYVKKPNEKVVLFSGGSTAWGLGASATDKTVAGRMQHYLNATQRGTTYSVFNLGMGSWIAFQQFVALQLWGEQFDPDWVVTMDGWNDAGVGCQFSQGVGNPMYFATMRSYIHGYLLSTQNPVFYRGWLENELIRHSAAYRTVTGKEVVEKDQVLDPTSTETSLMRRQVIPTKVGEAREMLAFYVGAVRGILKLHPKAKYIISTQPTVNTVAGDFVDIYDHPAGSEARSRAIEARQRDLEIYLTAHQDEECGEKAQVAWTYIFGNGAARLERLAEEASSQGRTVEYHNMGTLLPTERTDRMSYFVDPVHLSDKGMDVLGKFYAERILLSDGVQ